MKPKSFKPYALVFLFIIITGITVNAGEDKYSKDLHKEYETNDQTHLQITNKYGDVEITNWQKNMIVIDVKITVDHRKEEKAKELLEYITVDFSMDGNTISAVTNIDDKFNKSGWFFNFDSDNKEFSIDYDIKMPKQLQLTMENKYGNVFIDEVTGKADITIKYGNLKANKILRGNTKPLSHVYLAYSDGAIEEADWLKLSLKYSKMELEKSTAVIAVTKYSKFYNDQISSIVAESKYDHYYLGQISNLVVEAKYTDFKIDELKKKLDIETKYGDVEIDYIPKSFEEIRVDNKYGHIDIKIDDNASYNLKGEAEYGDIDYPSSKKMSKIEENTDLRVYGTIGREENPQATIRIETKYGNIDLR